MKLVVLAVGHRMPAWVSAGFEEYARRMPRDARLVLKEIRPEPRGAAAGARGQSARWLAAEGERIRAALPSGGFTVALDQAGQAYTTEQLADAMRSWRESGRDVAFVIGGADGLDARIKASAQLVLSLSPMTLPHSLVRVLLAEQLYRATSLLHNHPYHRA